MKYAEQTTVSSERSRAEIEMPPMLSMLNGGKR